MPSQEARNANAKANTNTNAAAEVIDLVSDEESEPLCARGVPEAERTLVNQTLQCDDDDGIEKDAEALQPPSPAPAPGRGKL